MFDKPVLNAVEGSDNYGKNRLKVEILDAILVSFQHLNPNHPTIWFKHPNLSP
jgi:hypothetical protein